MRDGQVERDAAIVGSEGLSPSAQKDVSYDREPTASCWMPTSAIGTAAGNRFPGRYRTPQF